MLKSNFLYTAFASISIFGVSVFANAQEAPASLPKEGRPPMARPMRMPERNMAGNPSGMFFARMLTRPEFIKELGLPDEKVKIIIDSLQKIEDQERKLHEDRMNLMKKQTDLLANLMSDRTKTSEEARKLISDIEGVQAKLSGLNIDRMLIVRDNLTDEQIKQASELVKKNFQSRRDEMMKRRGMEGRQRPGMPPPPAKDGNKLLIPTGEVPSSVTPPPAQVEVKAPTPVAAPAAEAK